MITEEKINDYLLTGLRAYTALKQKGWKKEADLVLAVTSNLVDNLITDNNFRQKYQKVFCSCGKQLIKGFQIEFFKRFKVCWENYVKKQKSLD